MNYVMISIDEIVDFCNYNEEIFSFIEGEVWVSDYTVSDLDFFEEMTVKECIEQNRISKYSISKHEYIDFCGTYYKYGGMLTITEVAAIHICLKNKNCSIINNDPVLNEIINELSLQSISYEKFKENNINELIINKPRMI